MTQETETQAETQTQAKAGAIIIPVTLFEQNCTLMWCMATKKAVVIDPGGDVPKIQGAITRAGVFMIRHYQDRHSERSEESHIRSFGSRVPGEGYPHLCEVPCLPRDSDDNPIF